MTIRSFLHALIWAYGRPPVLSNTLKNDCNLPTLFAVCSLRTLALSHIYIHQQQLLLNECVIFGSFFLTFFTLDWYAVLSFAFVLRFKDSKIKRGGIFFIQKKTITYLKCKYRRRLNKVGVNKKKSFLRTNGYDLCKQWAHDVIIDG